MPNKNSESRDHLPSWAVRFKEWGAVITLVSTLLGSITGVTVSSVFKLLEDYPSWKLRTQLVSIVLILAFVWRLYFYLRVAKREIKISSVLGETTTAPKYSKRKIMIFTLIAIVISVAGILWGNRIIGDYWKEREKTIILVARFDGKKEDEQRVMTHILEAVRQATKDISDVEVRSLDEIISAEEGSKKAREKGDARNAKLILWGWYDSDLIGSVHLEPLSSPLVNISFRDNQRRFSAVTEGGAIKVKQDLSGELSYLTLLVIGLLRIETKAYDDASRLLSRALAFPAIKEIVDPATIYFYRALTFHNQQKLDEALSDYSQAIKLNPDSPTSYINRGTVYHQKGRLDEALDDYSQAIKLKLVGPLSYVIDAISYRNRGLVYQDQGKLDVALADFSQAIKLKPDYADAYLDCGNVYRDQGKLDEALANYNQTIKFELNNAHAYSNRGVVYYHKGKLDEALADYNQAIKLKPDYAHAYHNRGIVYREKGRLGEALADSNQAIKLEPNDADAYFGRGIVYANQGKLDEALADYNQAIKLKPDNAITFNNRGNIYANQGKIGEALADYNQAIKLKHDYAPAYYNRGRAYINQRKLDEAVADYNQAIKFKTDYADAYFNRGAIYNNQGKLDEALADLNQAIKLEQRNAYAYFNRGFVYEKKNDRQSAIADFRKSLELFAHPADRKHAIEKLRSLGVNAE